MAYNLLEKFKYKNVENGDLVLKISGIENKHATKMIILHSF